MSEFINTLEIEFEKYANAKIASEQKAYMRNQFEFYGIKTPKRTEIQKPFLVKEYKPEKAALEKTIKTLWKKPQREYQYFSQELVFKYINEFEENDIELLEYMVTNKPWWDTVDFIANKLMGGYFKTYPDEKIHHIKKWINSNDIWLQRCALLFQIKYKSKLDNGLLSFAIISLLDSKEFFINKAIGWILREYSKTNPKWVLEFVKKTALNSLSKKEALRLIK